MSFSASNPNSQSTLRASSLGDGIKRVYMDWTAGTGDTSGTATIQPLSVVKHILVLGGRLVYSAAPTYSGNIATLAFTVPAETAASLTLGGVTYTAVANQGASGNSITIRYIGGGTAGSETVAVVGTAITVTLEDGVSTITQVRTAVNASAAAAALVTATGTSGTAVSAASATPLAGGVTGGGRGTLIALGY